MKSSKYLVYRHTTLDGNVFYIGISNNKYRPYYFYNRNNLWHKIFNKYGCKVDILSENLNKEDACELEEFLIELYGKRCDNTGCLANITAGGDGIRDYKFSEETLNKIRNSRKGYIMSEETKKKISQSLKGKHKKTSINYSKPKDKISDNRKKQISDNLKGKSYGKGISKNFNKVKQIDPFTNEVLNIFQNSVSASKYHKGDDSFASIIRKCCKGIRKITLGFKWEYV